MQLEELIRQIFEWGLSKGINNPEKQFQKLSEETIEAMSAWKDHDIHSNMPYECMELGYPFESDAVNHHLLEEIGDIGVVWLLLCRMLDISPKDALQTAHEKNKYRKGKTINGNFIKASDLAVYEVEKITEEDLESLAGRSGEQEV